MSTLLICLLVCTCSVQVAAATTGPCSSDRDCSEIHEVCSARNACSCQDGYVRKNNGTCAHESTTETSKVLYKILVAVFAVLIFICLLSIITVIFLCHRKTYHLEESDKTVNNEHYQMTSLKHKPSIRHILGKYHEPEYSHYDDGSSANEEDFERLVESLKTDAPLFLKMINEVKRKLTLLHDPNTTQGTQYMALIRDLSRVLQILNKSHRKLEMPSDGIALLLWAENALKRFECEDLQNPIKNRETYGECSTALQDAVL